MIFFEVKRGFITDNNIYKKYITILIFGLSHIGYSYPNQL